MEGKEEPLHDQIDTRLPAAEYARMSDDQQRKASIEDQSRNCHEGADEKGFNLLPNHAYKDEGKTGTTMFDRPGFAALRAAYRQKYPPFKVIIIDDTSRMGRNEADVFRVLDELEFYGIRIYFASDGLDSINPWFREAFAAKARQDAQFSKTHGKRVRRGRIGLFEKGLNPGWSCYGYKNLQVDSDDPNARGRAASEGWREVIDPEEAKIVVLIFTWYASGLSLRQITVRLNEQGVKPPRADCRKTKSSTWARSAVDYVLHNERYLGMLVYGRTTQIRNPETGKMVQRVNSESQWRRKENLDLRIVDRELWDKVVAERARTRRDSLWPSSSPICSSIQTASGCSLSCSFRSPGSTGRLSESDSARRRLPSTLAVGSVARSKLSSITDSLAIEVPKSRDATPATAVARASGPPSLAIVAEVPIQTGFFSLHNRSRSRRISIATSAP